MPGEQIPTIEETTPKPPKKPFGRFGSSSNGAAKEEMPKPAPEPVVEDFGADMESPTGFQTPDFKGAGTEVGKHTIEHAFNRVHEIAAEVRAKFDAGASEQKAIDLVLANFESDLMDADESSKNEDELLNRIEELKGKAHQELSEIKIGVSDSTESVEREKASREATGVDTGVVGRNADSASEASTIKAESEMKPDSPEAVIETSEEFKQFVDERVEDMRKLASRAISHVERQEGMDQVQQIGFILDGFEAHCREILAEETAESEKEKKVIESYTDSHDAVVDIVHDLDSVFSYDAENNDYEKKEINETAKEIIEEIRDKAGETIDEIRAQGVEKQVAIQDIAAIALRAQEMIISAMEEGDMKKILFYRSESLSSIELIRMQAEGVFDEHQPPTKEDKEAIADETLRKRMEALGAVSKKEGAEVPQEKVEKGLIKTEKAVAEFKPAEEFVENEKEVGRADRKRNKKEILKTILSVGYKTAGSIWGWKFWTDAGLAVVGKGDIAKYVRESKVESKERKDVSGRLEDVASAAQKRREQLGWEKADDAALRSAYKESEQQLKDAVAEYKAAVDSSSSLSPEEKKEFQRQLGVALNLYKKESQPPENEKREPTISNAKSLDDLFSVLKSKGSIQGSEEEYDADTLITRIQAVMDGKADVNVVTRSEGLRDKVAELLNRKKMFGDTVVEDKEKEEVKLKKSGFDILHERMVGLGVISEKGSRPEQKVEYAHDSSSRHAEQAIELYIRKKASGMEIAKDFSNAVLSASGLMMFRGATYGLAAITERARKKNLELNKVDLTKSGKEIMDDITGVEHFDTNEVRDENGGVVSTKKREMSRTEAVMRDLLIDSFRENAQNLVGANKGEWKVRDQIKAAGNFARAIGIAFMAKDFEDEKEAIQGLIDGVKEAKNISFEDIADKAKDISVDDIRNKVKDFFTWGDQSQDSAEAAEGSVDSATEGAAENVPEEWNGVDWDRFHSIRESMYDGNASPEDLQLLKEMRSESPELYNRFLDQYIDKVFKTADGINQEELEGIMADKSIDNIDRLRYLNDQVKLGKLYKDDFGDFGVTPPHDDGEVVAFHPEDVEKDGPLQRAAVERPKVWFEDTINSKELVGSDSIWRSTRDLLMRNSEDLGYEGDPENKDQLFRWAERETAKLVAELNQENGGDIADLVHDGDKVIINVENGKPHLLFDASSGEKAGHLSNHNVEKFFEGKPTAHGAEINFQVDPNTGDQFAEVMAGSDRYKVYDWDRDGMANVIMPDGSEQEMSSGDLERLLENKGVFEREVHVPKEVKVEDVAESHFSSYKEAKDAGKVGELFKEIIASKDQEAMSGFIKSFTSDNGFSESKSNIFLSTLKHDGVIKGLGEGSGQGDIERLQVAMKQFNEMVLENAKGLESAKEQQWIPIKIGDDYALGQKMQHGTWPFRGETYFIDTDGDHNAELTVDGNDALRAVWAQGLDNIIEVEKPSMEEAMMHREISQAASQHAVETPTRTAAPEAPAEESTQEFGSNTSYRIEDSSPDATSEAFESSKDDIMGRMAGKIRQVVIDGKTLYQDNYMTRGGHEVIIVYDEKGDLAGFLGGDMKLHFGEPQGGWSDKFPKHIDVDGAIKAPEAASLESVGIDSEAIEKQALQNLGKTYKIEDLKMEDFAKMDSQRLHMLQEAAESAKKSLGSYSPDDKKAVAMASVYDEVLERIRVALEKQ